MKTKQKTSKMLVHPASIEAMVAATWEFAYKILWDGHSFSNAEIALAKFYLRQYYESIPSKKFQRKALDWHTRLCRTIVVSMKTGAVPAENPSVFFSQLLLCGLFGSKKGMALNINNNN